MIRPILSFQSTPDDTYAFIAEWYDPNASLIRKYQLIFYCKDGTVEMVSYDIDLMHICILSQYNK